MKRLLRNQPNDLRFCVSIGLAIAVSQDVYRHSSEHFGILGGLLATGAAGAVIALLVALVWPAPKKGSPEATVAAK